MAPSLAELNALDEAGAVEAFLRCCGSTRWARAMAVARPFTDVHVMEAEADRIWRGLEAGDWLEAFAAHPRIGESSSREQAGMDAATDAVRQRLARANRDYEARFGFIYLVSAAGKTADELVAIVERRLTSSRDQELQVAAGEQAKITRLRLGQLFT